MGGGQKFIVPSFILDRYGTAIKEKKSLKKSIFTFLKCEMLFMDDT